MTKSLIAIDWGTTRARAFLIGADGEVKQRRSADRGIQSVASGGFPAAFEEIAGELRRAEPEAPVLLAGMVGSRNGWIEAPYVACPASTEAIASAALPVTLEDGSAARILPGLSCDEGAFDVMRGEETLIVGLEPSGRHGLPARNPFEMGRDPRRTDHSLRQLHDGRGLRAAAPALDPGTAGG